MKYTIVNIIFFFSVKLCKPKLGQDSQMMQKVREVITHVYHILLLKYLPKRNYVKPYQPISIYTI